MPAPAGAVRIVLHGTNLGGEIWETGFWMTGTGVNSQASADAQALVIGATLSSSDGSGAMRITMVDLASIPQVWTTVKCYAYPNGGTKATYIGEYVLPQPVTGGLPPALPNQCAQVLTLLTGAAGRSNRGRMYLPNNGVALQADGQVSVSRVSDVATAWALAFTDINASDAGKVVVVSQKLDAARQVTAVKMDTRVDIQRRRANKQAITGQHTSTVTP